MDENIAKLFPTARTWSNLSEYLDSDTAATLKFVTERYLAKTSRGPKVQILVDDLLAWKGVQREADGTFSMHAKLDEQGRLSKLNGMHIQDRRGIGRLIELEILSEELRGLRNAVKLVPYAFRVSVRQRPPEAV
jgi:hypothetical protein